MTRKMRKGPRDPEDDNNGQEKASGEEQEEDLGEGCIDEVEEVEYEEEKTEEIEGVNEVKENSNQQERVQMWFLKKKMKQLRKGRKKLEEKRLARRTAPGKGRWVPENLPRAGAELPNPGKRGSLSPSAVGCNMSGETFIVWCPHPLTLTYCMVESLRKKVRQSSRRSKQDVETGWKSRTEREAWLRSGVG